MEHAVAYAYVKSFEGCFGGQHHYAYVTHGEGDAVQVEKVLTRTDARTLNLLERQLDRFWGESGGQVYKPGDTTTRFETEKGAQKAVLAKALALWPYLDVIVYGEASTLSPQLVAWTRGGLASGARLYAIGTEMEAMYQDSDDPWLDFGEDKVEAICDEWQDLLASVPAYIKEPS
jgi:hypothetical protein